MLPFIIMGILLSIMAGVFAFMILDLLTLIEKKETDE